MVKPEKPPASPSDPELQQKLRDDGDDAASTGEGATEPPSAPSTCFTRHGRLWAVILSVISAGLNSYCSYLIKAHGIDYTDFLTMRSLIKLVVMPVLIVISGLEFWPKAGSAWVKFCVLLQGLLNGYIILTFFMTVVLLPLGEAMTIVLSCPIFTAILARIFLKQRLRLWKILFGILLFIGLFMVIQPPFMFPNNSRHQQADTNTTNTSSSANATSEAEYNPVEHDSLYYLGAAVGLSCAIVGGIYTVVLSGPCKGIPSFTLVMYSAFAGLLVAAISVTYNDNQHIMSSEIVELSTHDWLVLFGVALAAVIGNVAGIKAYQLTDPTTVIVIHQLEIVLGFIFQVFLLNEVSNLMAFLGSGLVLFGVLMFTFESYLVGKMPESIQKWF